MIGKIKYLKIICCIITVIAFLAICIAIKKGKLKTWDTVFNIALAVLSLTVPYIIPADAEQKFDDRINYGVNYIINYFIQPEDEPSDSQPQDEQTTTTSTTIITTVSTTQQKEESTTQIKETTTQKSTTKANKTYTLSFDSNGGSCSQSQKSVTYDNNYGTLPTPTKNYYTFDGWYTAKTGGTKVSSSDIYNNQANQTLYAHWSANQLYGWVSYDSVKDRDDIKIEKYQYIQKSTTTSSSSSLSGWSRDEGKTTYTIKWDNTVYYDTKQSTNELFKYIGTRTVNNGTETLTRLYRYYSSVDNTFSTWKKNNNYAIDEYWVSSYYKYDLYHSGQDLYMSNEITGQGYSDYPCWKGETKTIQKTKTQYGYQSGRKIYTYYFYKTETKESPTYPTGSNISNIKVKYIKK